MYSSLDHAHDDAHDVTPVDFKDHAVKPAFDHPDSHSYEGDIAVPVPVHHVEVVREPVHVVQPEVH